MECMWSEREGANLLGCFTITKFKVANLVLILKIDMVTKIYVYFNTIIFL